MKTEIPRFENGEIDFSKVDVHSDFRLFPRMFSNTTDIENFIKNHNVDAPVMSRILKLKSENKLALTDTESKFFFDSFFDYVYDVFRIPVQYTYDKTKDWLSNYLEKKLIQSGLSSVKEIAFDRVVRNYETRLMLEKLRKKDILKEINCYDFIGEEEENHAFYNTKQEKWVESFWIKTDLFSIQPIIKKNEAYARVHVYDDRVYIFGCDDCSYTLKTKTRKAAIAFARYLKCASPTWSFSHTKYIHKNLKFTN